MRKNVKKSIVFLLLAGMLGAVTPSAKPVFAETAYTYEDTLSGLSIAGTSIDVQGEHAVWVGSEGKLKSQIYYGNARTGQSRAITTHGKLTDSPSVGVNGNGEVIVVWMDKRNITGNTSIDWDIYMYNMSTKTEKKLNQDLGEQSDPYIDGNYVVWQTNPQYDMNLYDMSTGTLTDLGQGRIPVVKNGRIIYKGVGNGGLYEYTISSGTHKKILDLPYHLYVLYFDFNGSQILWMQKDLDGRGKYAFMDLDSSDPKPIDLTSPEKESVSYGRMSIGSDAAVWLKHDGTGAFIQAADLKSLQKYSLGSINPARFIGFNNNELSIVHNGKLTSREIVKTEGSAPAPSVPVEQKTSESGFVIGPKGGTAAAGQAASLAFEAGTFAADTRIQLEKYTVSADKLPKGMTWTGAAWKWTADAELANPASFNIAMENPLAKAYQANRTGLYRQDESSGNWVYAGGTLDSSWKSVHEKVQKPGIYGIFVYEPAFSDMSKHWAKTEVEVLASKWIVNGTSSGKYSPKQSVTRAQFAKMLVEAAGLETGKVQQASFKDVPAGHWAAPAVEQAVAAGWIKGYKGGLFKPNAPISREEMMVMLSNAAGLQKTEESSSITGYTDAELVQKWAKSSVQAVIESGMVKGNGNRILPKATSTRAEAAMVIYRWLDVKGAWFNE